MSVYGYDTIKTLVRHHPACTGETSHEPVLTLPEREKIGSPILPGDASTYFNVEKAKAEAEMQNVCKEGNWQTAKRNC